MFYREAGQYNTTYEQDLQAFPIKQDRIGIAIWLLLAYLFVPFFGIPQFNTFPLDFRQSCFQIQNLLARLLSDDGLKV